MDLHLSVYDALRERGVVPIDRQVAEDLRERQLGVVLVDVDVPTDRVSLPALAVATASSPISSTVALPRKQSASRTFPAASTTTSA
jgi:hypothetical protein